MGKYWYFITYLECPVCWRHSEYRERRYTPRPEAYEDRHKFIEHYDYCLG